MYTIYNKNEKICINTEDLCRLGCFKSWRDEVGNIISTQEEFEFVITENTTIYLYTDGFDIFHEDENIQYYFSIF